MYALKTGQKVNVKGADGTALTLRIHRGGYHAVDSTATANEANLGGSGKNRSTNSNNNNNNDLSHSGLVLDLLGDPLNTIDNNLWSASKLSCLNVCIPLVGKTLKSVL